MNHEHECENQEEGIRELLQSNLEEPISDDPLMAELEIWNLMQDVQFLRRMGSTAPEIERAVEVIEAYREHIPDVERLWELLDYRVCSTPQPERLDDTDFEKAVDWVASIDEIISVACYCCEAGALPLADLQWLVRFVEITLLSRVLNLPLSVRQEALSGCSSFTKFDFVWNWERIALGEAEA